MNNNSNNIIKNIDLVYLWCDGNDPKFKHQRKKTYERYHHSKLDTEGTSNFRFVQTDELKYSLRSVEKYAPWIRNIYIVTNNQKPEWLNEKNKKIKIIDHKEIIPEKYLPTFNSTVIEIYINKIPNLSEHFLYANDDMFFWNKVSPEFFFSENGVPIFRASKRITKKPKNSLYGDTIYNSYQMILNKFNKETPYWTHHGIDSYRKSDIDECIKYFKDEFDNTSTHQFREATDIQRIIFSYYTIAKKNAIVREYPRKWYDNFIQRINETNYSSCTIKKMKLYQNKDFKLFCINDGRKTKDKDRLYMKKMLELKFPNKSQFEN